MTIWELITVGIVVLLVAAFLTYSGWVLVYALRDDSLVRERLKKGTQ